MVHYIQPVPTGTHLPVLLGFPTLVIGTPKPGTGSSTSSSFILTYPTAISKVIPLSTLPSLPALPEFASCSSQEMPPPPQPS